jgi:hypothetical protein
MARGKPWGSVVLVRVLCYCLQSVCLVIVEPPADPSTPAANTFEHVTAGFGPALPAHGVTAKVVWATPADACRKLSTCEGSSSCEGKIIVVVRGNCDFFQKVMHAQVVGASAVVIVSSNQDSDDELITMSAGDEAAAVKIPSVYVLKGTGDRLRRLRHGKSASMPHTVVTLNATGELGNEPMDELMLAALDPLVSPFRRDSIHSGMDSDAEYKATDELQILVDIVSSQTAVKDRSGSEYLPSGASCSSLQGPNCLAIRSRFKKMGGLKGAVDVNQQLSEADLAALQAQLEAQLQQYGGKVDTESMQSVISDLWKNLGQKTDSAPAAAQKRSEAAADGSDEEVP